MRWSYSFPPWKAVVVKTGFVKSRIARPAPCLREWGIEPSYCYTWRFALRFGAWCRAGVARSSIHPQKLRNKCYHWR
jgi:hypothetical protein